MKMICIRNMIVALLAQMYVAPVNAELTNQDLEDTLGESAAYRKVYDEIKYTIAKDDREGFAALVHYPFSVLRQKGCCTSEVVDTIENSTEFVEKFDQIVTPDVVGIIREQKFDDMILKWDGLAFTHGAVWIVGFCTYEDEADPCAETVVGIKTINSIALVDKPDLPLSKPDLTLSEKEAWTLLVGTWYGEQPTKDGGRRQWLVERFEDGRYSVDFRITEPDGTVRKSAEVGEWATSGPVYFSSFRGWVRGTIVEPADRSNPHNYDAYRIIELGNELFEYEHFSTGYRFTVRRVPSGFQIPE